MRIMGFTRQWGKLSQPQFTTFRAQRKDKDWYCGEIVQIVVQPRNRSRRPLGIARISAIETKTFKEVAEAEAIADGFVSILDMWLWLKKAHKGIDMTLSLNKLTLEWQVKEKKKEV